MAEPAVVTVRTVPRALADVEFASAESPLHSSKRMVLGGGVGSMRMGLMVGPERGRYATKVERMRADATWAEQAGFASVWIPQIPNEFDALTAAALVAAATTR